MATRRFDELHTRVKTLGENMLPAPSLTGDYSASDEDRIRAYVLLVHAEIESFIEEIALEHLALAEKKSNFQFCTPTVARLLLYNKIDNELPTNEQISTVIAKYRHLVKNNHGVKTANVLSLFVPLGFSHTDFSPSVLIALSGFGEVRGGFAHRSYKTTQPKDPVTQKNEVEGILVEIKNIAARLKSLK